MNTEIKGRSVTLTLTNKCNLNCIYCYESKKSSSKMTYDIAKNIIDKETNESNGTMIIFELFGGEPFLEFDLIKKIYNCIEEKNLKKWIMFATTNGTLVHGEIQNWLVEHKKHFVCGLSLDGNRNMHNINRSNSFDKIDIDFFRTNYPNQHVKMTISPDTLPSLSEGVIFLHEIGFRVNCNLAFGIDWSDIKNITILEKELKLLIDYYLKNPDEEPCSILGLGFEQIVKKKGEFIKKWCGTGTHMHTYDINGKCYPCQFFMPLSVGDEKALLLEHSNFKEEISLQELDEKCQSCVVSSACPTCYGSNYINTGNVYSKDDYYCKMMKVIMKARSYFRAKQWELGQLNVSDAKKDAILKAILKIQKELV